MNKKNFFFLNVLLLLSFSCLSTKLKKVRAFSTKKCLKSQNEWGVQRYCSCAKPKTFYDKRLGVCLRNHRGFEERLLIGLYSESIFAIGGETSGATLKVGEDVYDLYLNELDKEKLKKFDGKKIKVKGFLFILEGVEIKERKAFIVNNIY